MRPRRRTTAISWIVLSVMMVAPLSHSQPRQPQTSAKPNMDDIMRRQQELKGRLAARQMAQFREQVGREAPRAVDESRRQSIGATPSQWRSIQPRLLAVEGLHLEMMACLRPHTSIGSFSAPEPVIVCEWVWKPLADKEPNAPLTAAEATCHVLRDMLADEQTPIEAVWEQVELLRAQRNRAAEQVPAAEEALRNVATLRQEAALMAKGWLR